MGRTDPSALSRSRNDRPRTTQSKFRTTSPATLRTRHLRLPAPTLKIATLKIAVLMALGNILIGPIPAGNAQVLLSQATEGTYPTLTANSTGDSVSRLQATLKLLGFYQGAVDGTYTPATQDAVSRFQSTAGITADGVTGPSTWQALLPAPEEVTATPVVATTPAQQPAPEPTAPAPEAAPEAAPEPAAETAPSGPPVLRPDAEGSAVAQLQRELQALDYYSGSIDGGYGEETQAAVMDFQRDQQLSVDAVVGPSTWDALSRALGQ